jgi:hypothetical protein
MEIKVLSNYSLYHSIKHNVFMVIANCYVVCIITFPQTRAWVGVELVILHSTRKPVQCVTCCRVLVRDRVSGTGCTCTSTATKSTFPPVPGPRSISTRTVKKAHTPEKSNLLPTQNIWPNKQGSKGKVNLPKIQVYFPLILPHFSGILRSSDCHWHRKVDLGTLWPF